MRVRNTTGISALAFAKTSAGWVVTRYEGHKDETDVLAGAFGTPEEAIEAARAILNAELDKALLVLHDHHVGGVDDLRTFVERTSS